MKAETVLTVIEKEKYEEIKKLLSNSYETLSEVESKLWAFGQYKAYNKTRKLIRQMERLRNELY